MRKLVCWIKKILLALFLVFFSAFCGILQANDLGVIGPTYSIAERDMIELIQSRIQQKKANGELNALYRGMSANAKQYVARPPGVVLPRATYYRAVEINPLYTVPEDIVDASGKVLFKAGTQVNPLAVKPLTKTLCFIDGDDPVQVVWLETYCTDNLRNKLILTNGDYLAVAKHLASNKAKTEQLAPPRIYFDQQGNLVNRLGIQALPAVVRQSGLVIYVEEFAIQ